MKLTENNLFSVDFEYYTSENLSVVFLKCSLDAHSAHFFEIEIQNLISKGYYR